MKLFKVYFIDVDDEAKKKAVVATSAKAVGLELKSQGRKLLKIEEIPVTITTTDIYQLNQILEGAGIQDEKRALILKTLEKAFS